MRRGRQGEVDREREEGKGGEREKGVKGQPHNRIILS